MTRRTGQPVVRKKSKMPRPDGRIGHAEIQIGDTTVMMADEHPESGAFGPEHYGGPQSACIFMLKIATELINRR